ncbi:calcium release-activated calcium channel protein 1-like isoform X2 [Artemia franciscana]|uniref:Calcium release-activated calcium channel protein 1 n=1 Tax=Artemia franciscana TaxID=6661 RepID=A0AA88HEM7_ARTSF|nr:hypothetical protein QYM36_017820 [Artemia franciscana]
MVFEFVFTEFFRKINYDQEMPPPRLRSNSTDFIGNGLKSQSKTVLNQDIYSNASTEFINHINSYVPNKPLEQIKSRGSFYSPSFQSWKKLHTSRAQLKAVSNISALLAGFAMVAMVEINLQDNLPDALYIAFASCTTVLVVMHTLALMISTCILPHVDTIAGLKRADLVDESPHEMLRSYIQLAWVLSTVTGIVLFMVEVVLLCWVQFYSYSINAAYASTGIVLPSLLIFGYMALKFYKNLNKHMEMNSQRDLSSLENVAEQLKGTIDGRRASKERTYSIIDMPQ